MKLLNIAHLAQLIGYADDEMEYGLSPEITQTLAKLRKVPIVNENEIDVGLNTLRLQSVDGIFDFYLKDSIVYLSEQAQEMGGLIAYTYLTPISQFDEDYVDNLGDADLSHLTTRIIKRREKQNLLMQEHERLSRGANRRAQKFLRDNKSTSVSCALVSDECAKLLKQAKYFIRRGKADYYGAQLQIMQFVIQKNDLGENQEIIPLVEIIGKYCQKCENKSQKELSDGFVSEIYQPKFTASNTKIMQNKRFDFRELLVALSKPQPKGDVRKQFEKEYPAKSKVIMGIYTAEEEVQQEVKMPETVDMEKAEQTEESKAIQLAETIFAEYGPNKQAVKSAQQDKTAEIKKTKADISQKSQYDQEKTF